MFLVLDQVSLAKKSEVLTFKSEMQSEELFQVGQLAGGKNNDNYPIFQDRVFVDNSLLRDSTISSALNFVFDLFYCNLKGKYHIRRKIYSKKSVCMQNQYFLF